MNFTKNFILKNIKKNQNNRILIIDPYYVNNIEIIKVTNEKKLNPIIKDIEYIFKMDKNTDSLNNFLTIKYSINNDLKLIEVSIIIKDYIYCIKLNFNPNFDIKNMLNIFLSKNTNKDIFIEFIENENRQILKYTDIYKYF